MGWMIAVLVLIYLGGLRYVARRYFALRHGVSLEKGEQGALSASMIGAAWPATLFLSSVRHPTMCNHHRHVLQHARLTSEIQRVDEIVRQREQH
jgi:hypothetical protein